MTWPGGAASIHLPSGQPSQALKLPAVHPMRVLQGLGNKPGMNLTNRGSTCLGELSTPTESRRIPPLPLHTWTSSWDKRGRFLHLHGGVVQLEATVLN